MFRALLGCDWRLLVDTYDEGCGTRAERDRIVRVNHRLGKLAFIDDDTLEGSRCSTTVDVRVALCDARTNDRNQALGSRNGVAGVCGSNDLEAVAPSRKAVGRSGDRLTLCVLCRRVRPRRVTSGGPLCCGEGRGDNDVGACKRLLCNSSALGACGKDPAKADRVVLCKQENIQGDSCGRR